MPPKVKPKRKPVDKTLRANVWLKCQGKEYNGLCWCCRKGIDHGNFECAHVISVADGGETTLQNLVTACSLCNRSMQSEHFYAYAKSVGFNALKVRPTKEEIENAHGITPSNAALAGTQNNAEAQGYTSDDAPEEDDATAYVSASDKYLTVDGTDTNSDGSAIPFFSSHIHSSSSLGVPLFSAAGATEFVAKNDAKEPPMKSAQLRPQTRSQLRPRLHVSAGVTAVERPNAVSATASAPVIIDITPASAVNMPLGNGSSKPNKIAPKVTATPRFGDSKTAAPASAQTKTDMKQPISVKENTKGRITATGTATCAATTARSRDAKERPLIRRLPDEFVARILEGDVIPSGRTKVQSGYTSLTALRAAAPMFEKYRGNREIDPVRAGALRNFQEKMYTETGNYAFGVTPIVICRFGERLILIDGQHRLTAIKLLENEGQCAIKVLHCDTLDAVDAEFKMLHLGAPMPPAFYEAETKAHLTAVLNWAEGEYPDLIRDGVTKTPRINRNAAIIDLSTRPDVSNYIRSGNLILDDWIAAFNTINTAAAAKKAYTPNCLKMIERVGCHFGAEKKCLEMWALHAVANARTRVAGGIDDSEA